MVGVYNMSVSESTGYNSALGGAYRAVRGSTGHTGRPPSTNPAKKEYQWNKVIQFTLLNSISYLPNLVPIYALWVQPILVPVVVLSFV